MIRAGIAINAIPDVRVAPTNRRIASFALRIEVLHHSAFVAQDTTILKLAANSVVLNACFVRSKAIIACNAQTAEKISRNVVALKGSTTSAESVSLAITLARPARSTLRLASNAIRFEKKLLFVFALQGTLKKVTIAKNAKALAEPATKMNQTALHAQQTDRTFQTAPAQRDYMIRATQPFLNVFPAKENAPIRPIVIKVNAFSAQMKGRTWIALLQVISA